jgi:hypothetical protein
MPIAGREANIAGPSIHLRCLVVAGARSIGSMMAEQARGWNWRDHGRDSDCSLIDLT